jgi:hypothetical protein
MPGFFRAHGANPCPSLLLPYLLQLARGVHKRTAIQLPRLCRQHKSRALSHSATPGLCGVYLSGFVSSAHRPTRHRLVVLQLHITNLDVGLDLEATRRRLVMVARYPASFHVRFDFHGCFPFLESSIIGGASHLALTLVLTFKPRATVWLWLPASLPALTFVLIFILMVSFLEKLK